MPTTITSADVVDQFGEYYINNGQNENDIHDTLREQLEDIGDFTVVDSDDTILRAANVEYTEVLQAFQTAFTPKGSVTFTPKEIPLFNVKIDQQFYPDVLKNQWLAFLTSENLDRTTWPFVRWFIEKYVLPQINHDLVKNLYGAVRVAPTEGTAGAASASFNGLRKIINDGITGNTIVPITTGVPNTNPTTWLSQVETFCQSIPELYWETSMGLKMSRALALRYKRGFRMTYDAFAFGVKDNLSLVTDFENIQVIGRGSMTGVSKIWTTPKLNAIMAFKGGSNRGMVEVEKVDRMVKVYTDFWIGLGFIQDALVWTNDQDTTES
ncbi:MAG TPA: hypothetical protein VG847_13930 [Chitinophagaceae bacterium]|nr:hypothetical protein [Chitinophagaceae bacterium]